MIAAEHVADAGGGLFERLIARQSVLIHRVEDPAVDGLQPVAHVGQRASDDDGHGVLDIGGLHLVDELAPDDLLVGEADILGLIIYVSVCHFDETSFLRSQD